MSEAGTASRWADKLMNRIVDVSVEALGVRRTYVGFCEKAIQEVIVVAALCVKRNCALDEQTSSSTHQLTGGSADACLLRRLDRLLDRAAS